MNREWIDSKTELINSSLLKSVDPESFAGSLSAAFTYCVSGSGKRLRPLLSLAISEDLILGNDFRQAAFKNTIPASFVALELLHLASLVHDDLPALDNDDFRRGKPTIHKVFGEGQAVLLADLMIGAAFGLLVVQPSCNTRLAVLTKAWRDLCLGQSLDISSKSELLDSLQREKINALKTGALFLAAFKLAAIESETQSILDFSEAFADLGIYFGELFQQQDDQQDLESKGGSVNFFEKFEQELSTFEKNVSNDLKFVRLRSVAKLALNSLSANTDEKIEGSLSAA